MKYEYYNPNPKKRFRRDGKPMGWHKGDCTTRALAKALDCTWKEAFQKQCDEAMKQCDNTKATSVTNAVLLANGFRKGVIDIDWIKKYHQRPTVARLVNDVCKQLGNRKLVISCTHHLVAAEGDTIYDTWNSGKQTAWTFWYK